ncbi:MAG: hypothetical protein MJK04_17400, partial [Psychrosphaera sp.]|nr:hypothetical protein [Psychrosphaera sp.]
YRRITHEVAHQWWGVQLDPALIQGNLVMIETMAKYSEMQIMNKHLGKAQVRDLVQFEARRYLRGRTMENDEEMPLYLAKGNQNHILYSKGNNVMYQLNHLLGEQKMNEMMAGFLSQYAYPAKPPTSLDFLELFYAAVPADMHQQIDELMKEIIIYDLSIEEATVTKLDDGRYKVDVQVKALKNSFSGKGIATPMVMDEQIEIGIYNQFPDGEQLDTGALMLTEQAIKDGVASFSFVVDEQPKHVVIDPNFYRIDSNRENNRVRL